MTIPAGTRIGHFTVVELIGAGGMGAVYRAHDPRLRREVALKMLPPAFDTDPGRLRRFEQEALAVARLAHPNILAIHDVGAHDGAPYMVAELLEGETLTEVMRRRRPSIEKAIAYTIQIADGLAAAHDQGIVHRDIKPDNLFVTSGGRIKILDFGIARLIRQDSPAGTTAATETAADLGPIGTAAYMAPEQARGARADHRADLFSLGIVLYEMVSGVSPFRRETGAESMAAVIQDDPPPLDQKVGCPPALARIVRRLLEKDPAHRFQSARDLIFALEGTLQEPSLEVGRSRPRWRAAAIAAAALLPLGLGGGFFLGRWTAPVPHAARVEGIHRLTDFVGLEDSPAISPDLKSVAFTARVNGHRQVFVRLLAAGPPLQITRGAADHELPRWSPDAASIVYFTPAVPGDAQGTTWSIPALGGPPRRLVDSLGGCDVSRDSRLACFRLAEGHIELITASLDGSEAARVVTRFEQAAYFKYPRWSPDARWVAYQRGDGFRWDIFALPVDGGAPRQLTHDSVQIHGLSWLDDGRAVVYSASRGASMPYLPTLGLWRVPLEGGEPTRIAAADLSYLHPDVHASGAVAASRLRMDFDLWSYPIAGTPAENVSRGVRISTQTGQVQTPTVGATDEEVAFLSDSGGHANLWVATRATGELRQITHERDPSVSVGVPVWSPDGRRIAFVSSRGHAGLTFGVWLINPDGGDLRNVATRGLGVTWSSDGQWLYYTEGGAVYKVPSAGGAVVQVRAGPARNVVAWHRGTLYFMVDRTLTDGSPGFEIHAASPEGGPSRVLARIAASRAPQWQIIQPALSPDGTLFALPRTDGDTTNIWTVSATTGEWRQVTDFGGRPIFIVRRVAWSADGRSILAAIGEGDADIVLLESSAPPR